MKRLFPSLTSLIFLLIFSALAFGQGAFIPPQTALKNVNGLVMPIANATITVCAGSAAGIPCSPPLTNTIFADIALTQPLSNPFTADANGNYQFAAAPGTFTVTVTAAGFAGFSYQVTTSSGSGSNLLPLNNNWTGSNTYNAPVTIGPSTPAGVSALLFNQEDPYCLANPQGYDQLCDQVDLANGSSALSWDPNGLANQRVFTTAFQSSPYVDGNIMCYSASTGLPITCPNFLVNSQNGIATAPAVGISVPADTGTANAYVACPTGVNPATVSLSIGLQAYFVAGHGNTGASTLNWCMTGIQPLKKISSSGLAALLTNDISTSPFIVKAVWDGTEWDDIEPGTVSASGGGTVNTGTANQIAFYATSTNAVSGNARLTESSGAGLVYTGTAGISTSLLDFTGSGAFMVQYGQGALSTAAANSWNVSAPTTVTATPIELLPTAAYSGFRRLDNSSGTMTPTTGELSGDCTTSGGSLATTCSTVGGGAVTVTKIVTSAAALASGHMMIGGGSQAAQTATGIQASNTLFTSMNAESLAGLGVAYIRGSTSQKSETGSADGSLLSITPAGTAGSYRACFDASVSSATSGVIGWTLSWTDSNGNAQSNIAMSLFQEGTAAPANTFTTSAAGNYDSCHKIDVDNSGSTIAVKWVGGGTTVAKVSAIIERIQ